MDDESFGELLVQQGVSTRERIRECIALRNRMAEAGVSPIPSLVDLLAQKGYISSATQQATMKMEATVRASSRPIRSATSGAAPAMPPEAVQAANDPANVMGKYVRVKRVGVGGMGEVWRAWDRTLGRWVALKSMKYDDPGELERFRREAQTAAKLSHPNIGAIYEAEDAWIAMQFVNGQTLATFPRNDHRQLVGLIRDAALALQHAHEQDVIHRDLKPHNLMVEGKGKAARVYVMDFGLAKQAKAESSLSAAGSVLGTPAYMPPEQARGRIEEVDARSDVYSLGATLYELLGNRTPFVSKDVYDLLKRVIEDDPQPLRQVSRKVDEDLETIVMKCLEKDPARRYGSMQELADELGRWLAGEAILAHPPSAAYKLRKFLTRRKGLVAAVASTSVLALAAWLILGAVSRGREFDRLKEEAGKAFGEKRWAEARTAAARALELKEDASLVTLVADATGRAKAEEAEKQKKIAEGRAFRALQDRLKPVESLINETRPFFYIQSIDIRAKLDKVEQVLAEVEAIAKAPEHAGYAEPWLLLGMGRYFVGDPERALEALTRAESLKPDDGRIQFYLAKVWVERGELAIMLAALGADDALGDSRDRGLEWLKKAAEHARRSAGGWAGVEEVDRHLAACYDAAARQETGKLRQLCLEGRQRFPGTLGSEEFVRLMSGISGGEPKEKIALLSESLQRRPHDDLALYERATWRYIAKEHARSVDDFRQALKVNPRLAYAHLGLASALDQAGDPEGSILEAGRFIDLFPGLVEGYAMRAIVRGKTRDYAGGEADCTRALGINPKSWRCLVLRGTARRRSGNLDGAVADFTAALGIEPQPAVYANRGQAWLQKGNLEKSLADHDEAIRGGHRAIETFLNRSLVHTRMGNHDLALKDIEEAIRIDPELPKCYTRRASVRVEKDDYDGAIQDTTRVLDRTPDNAEALAIRGQARMCKKDWDGALKDFEAARIVSPNEGFRKTMDELIGEVRKGKGK